MTPLPTIDPVLLRIFESEVSEGQQSAQSILLGMESGAHGPESGLEDILRIAHNLKGSARVAGLEGIGSFVHSLEARLMTWRDLDPTIDGDIDLALRAFDLLGDFAHQPEDLELLRQAEELAAELGCEPAAVTGATQAPVESEAELPARLPKSGTRTTKQASSHRVSRETLDEVRDTVSDVLAGMFEAQAHLKDLDRAMRRLTSVTLPDDADDQLGEARSDLRRALGDLRPVLHRLDQETRELEERSRALCLVPVSPLVGHLERVVRDTAKQLSRSVRMEVRGGDLDMDIELVESLKGPLAHIVRNAVDHGIETAAARRSLGKPEQGTIELSLEHSGDRVIVTVQDDGGGIDVDGVRRRLGPMAEGMSDHDLCQTVLMAGFSTRDEATEISGRGIGLGAVAQMAAEMRGQVEVVSERGRGTTVRVDLPVNLSIVQGLSVLVAGVHLVLPGGGLAGLPEQHPAGAVALSQVLGLHGDAGSEVVLLRGRDGDVAVRVERVLEPVEIVRRELGAHLGAVRFLQGATILEHGQPALIIDLHEVLAACEALAGPAPSMADRRILVVDDSATLRAMMQSALVGAGFEVVLAEDGAQALECLEAADFDAVVSDVQMPRLDGLQLLERVAGRTPVILATSFPNPSDERRAQGLGVRAYLPKDDSTGKVVVRILHELLHPSAERTP